MIQPHRGDQRALRGTRIRLALWSGAITLVVLWLLGGGLYLVVARQLATESENQLRARAQAMTSDPFLSGLPMAGTVTVTESAEMPGLIFGGPLSGTVADVVFVDALDLGPVIAGGLSAEPGRETPVTGLLEYPEGPAGLLDPAALDGLMDTPAGQIATIELDGTPVRVLTTPLETAQGTALVRVLSDRSAEVGTLETLLLILLVAVPLGAVAAALAGWVYSGRALVPIRLAIERQRRFAADASHELRTPLTILSGNLQALASTDGPITHDDEAITDSMAEADRMTALLDDLLLLARTDAEALPIEIAGMDLADEVIEAVDSLATSARDRDITLTLDVEPTPMQGDPGRLRQLVVILVDNAIRYGTAGGHTWITARPVGGGATLVVADDGPGIPAADRDQAFERFWRGSGTTAPGNGLGLPIARWIATAHGGRITLDERPSGGTRVMVSLPDQP